MLNDKNYETEDLQKSLAEQNLKIETLQKQLDDENFKNVALTKSVELLTGEIAEKTKSLKSCVRRWSSLHESQEDFSGKTDLQQIANQRRIISLPKPKKSKRKYSALKPKHAS